MKAENEICDLISCIRSVCFIVLYIYIYSAFCITAVLPMKLLMSVTGIPLNKTRREFRMIRNKN